MVQLLGSFARDNRGTVSIEYVAVGALVILILYAVFDRLFTDARTRHVEATDTYETYIPATDMGP